MVKEIDKEKNAFLLDNGKKISFIEAKLILSPEESLYLYVPSLDSYANFSRKALLEIAPFLEKRGEDYLFMGKKVEKKESISF